MGQYSSEQYRELLLLRSTVAAALRDLERFADKHRPDDLVLAAQSARLMFEDARAVIDDQARLLIAVSDALAPFPTSDEGTIVDKVRSLVECWRSLEGQVKALQGGAVARYKELTRELVAQRAIASAAEDELLDEMDVVWDALTEIEQEGLDPARVRKGTAGDDDPQSNAITERK